MTELALLIIAYGNSLRRDDGAGLVLGAKLAATWQAAGHVVALREVHQLMPELAEEIAESGASGVLFVDASVANSDPHDVRNLQSVPLDDASPSLGHHLGPAVVMQYAVWLYECRVPAWLITVAAHDLSYGEGLSAEARTQVEAIVARSGEIWEAMHG